jgi:hypothetical protein
MKKSNIVWGIIGIIIIGFVLYFVMMKNGSPVAMVTPEQTTATDTVPTYTTHPVDTTKTIIGSSVEKRDITAYHYGTGNKELLFVGGIHGGYEWNTVLVAYQLMDYLKTNPEAIPKNITVTVIPVLNPDGLKKVVDTADRFTASDVPASKATVIAGRYNANGVDLNRNFDCDWQAKGIWQQTPVSGGTAAFSEPESQAFKNYVDAHTPVATVTWYSSAGGVYSSSCDNGNISPETKTLTATYAKGSGYKAYDSYARKEKHSCYQRSPYDSSGHRVE